MVPATETAPPKSTALSLATVVKVWPNRGEGISPVILIFSAATLRMKYPLVFDYYNPFPRPAHSHNIFKRLMKKKLDLNNLLAKYEGISTHAANYYSPTNDYEYQ